MSSQYLRRLYASPAPELDLGTFIQSATILMSDDLLGFHFDVNGLVTEQQDENTRVRRSQFAQTFSISYPIGKFRLWRDMALHTAVVAQLCGWEP